MPSCFHEQPGNIRRFQVGRVSYFGLQCPECLRLVGPKLSPSDLDEGEGQLHPGEVPRAEKKKPFQGGGNSRRRKYRKYIQSRAWRIKRSRRLELDGWVCQLCGEIAEEVDHKKYLEGDQFGQERMDDLQSLCTPCHRQVTQDRIGS